MTSAEERVMLAEYKSLFYKFFSTAVRYPTEELAKRFGSDEFWQGLTSILEATACAESCSEILQQKDAICQEMEQGAISLEMEYNRLFQLSQQFACPLTASEYLPGESRQAVAVAQLKGLYKAFGLQLRPATEADHLSVLLEFMSFLWAKEAHAINRQDENDAEQCVKAKAIVLEDFLGWLPLFLSTVKLNASMKFYPWISSLLIEFLRAERQVILCASTGEQQ